jgi:hypothetical protein
MFVTSYAPRVREDIYSCITVPNIQIVQFAGGENRDVSRNVGSSAVQPTDAAARPVMLF